MRRLWLALSAALLAAPAAAHCPISFVVSGPGGLFWQADIDGDLYDGMLPGGAPGRLGARTSWTETRRYAITLGTAPVRFAFSDGTHHVACPPVIVNLSGPPRCSEDYDAPGEVPHLQCIPFFTAVQTAPGVFSCASVCQPATVFPAPQSYVPPAPSSPPSLSSLSPASSTVSAAPLALNVSGSGFAGNALVEWNGTPLPTAYIGGGSLLALVPAALLSSPGTASVKVTVPGAASSSLTFTVVP